MIIHEFNHNNVAQTFSIVLTPQHKDREEKYIILSNIISVTANSMGLMLTNSDSLANLIEKEISDIASNPPASVCLRVFISNSIIRVERFFDTPRIDFSTIKQ